MTKTKRTLTLIAVALVLIAGVAFATGTIIDRADASTQMVKEESTVDFTKLNETDETEPSVEETETSIEETTTSTTATAPATTSKPTNTKIDGEADVLKTNTEVKNNGVTDTTSSTTSTVVYKEKEATTVSVTTPPAPPAPAEKKNEKATETTTSETTTSSETVRFDNNLPVNMVENADSQEVITEEVVEIAEEKVSDELADLFG